MTLLRQELLANASRTIELQMSYFMCESLLPLFKHLMSAFHVDLLADGAFSGAVKSNIGHLEGTSGIAGIIKAILAVEKGIIPPNTNFERLNTRIDAEFFNLEVSCRFHTTIRTIMQPS